MKKPKMGDVRYSYTRTKDVYTKPGFWSVGDEEELPPGARVLTPEDIEAGLNRCGLGKTRQETADYLNEELFDRGTRAAVGKTLTREQVYYWFRKHEWVSTPYSLEELDSAVDELFGESEASE